MHSIEINKLFVDIFRLLFDASANKQYDKLSVVFGTMVFNEQLLLKFSTEYQNNVDTIENMSYFHNTTMKELYPVLSSEDQACVKTKLNEIYEHVQNDLKRIHCPSSSESSSAQNFSLLNEVMKKHFNLDVPKHKLEKIFEQNPQLTKLLQQQQQQLSSNLLSSSSSVNENNIDESDSQQMLNLLSNVFGDTDAKEHFEKLRDNFPQCKKIFETMQKIDTQKIFAKIEKTLTEKHPEILEDMDKIVQMLDMEKIRGIVDTIHDKLQSVDITNMDSILTFVKQNIDENPSIQNILWKLHMSIQSGLINMERLSKHGEVVLKIVCNEFSAANLLTSMDANNLFSLLFSKKSKKKKIPKKKRKETRIKKQRRKIKSKLKNRQKHKS